MFSIIATWKVDATTAIDAFRHVPDLFKSKGNQEINKSIAEGKIVLGNYR